jgi:ABC-type spermidine/putrescine transport system permease subunit I
MTDHQRNSRWTPPVWSLAVPVLLFLAVCYAFPVGSVLAISVTDPGWGLQHYRQLLGASVYGHVFLATLRLAGTVTLATVLLGYPMAYFLTIATERQRRWVIFLILVPSWTSVLVRTYGWLVLLGRFGIVNGLLMTLGVIHQPLPLLYNGVVVGLAMVEILLPFLVLPLFNTMRSIDLNLMQAASGLGAGRIDSFLRVYLPLSLPGVIAGASIVFVLSLGFFITPTLLGSRHDLTVSMLIMQQFTSVLDWGFGAALATALLITALLALGGLAWIGRGTTATGRAS